MNQEAKTLLLAALRSGEYTQGRVALDYVRPDDTHCHCVMGIACDLALQAGVDFTRSETPQVTEYINPTPTGYDVHGRMVPSEGCRAYEFDAVDMRRPTISSVPPSVITWLGISSHQETVIMSKNDGGMSFAELADFIEERF